MSESNKIIKELKSYSSEERAVLLSGFFKTGKGEYGEGDKFLGLKVGEIRETVKKYENISLFEIKKLLVNPFHEIRLAGVFILVEKNKKTFSQEEKEKIFKFYLQNTGKINNWDLVDSSAGYIVGEYLFNKNKSLLYKLAKSKSIWERRIAIISTFYFIRKGKCLDTFKISKILFNDKEDLIHKAIGWMLREAGKNCGEEKLENFLCKNIQKIPRTSLRYAIERFDDKKRKKYLFMR